MSSRSHVLLVFLTQSPCQDLVPSRRLQPAQVPVRRQPEGGARVVHSHHPHGVGERRRGHRDRVGLQDPQLQPPRDRQQHQPHAEPPGPPAAGKLWFHLRSHSNNTTTTKSHMLTLNNITKAGISLTGLA